LRPTYIALPLAEIVGPLLLALGITFILFGSGKGARRAGLVLAFGLVLSTGVLNEFLIKYEAVHQPRLFPFTWAAWLLASVGGERSAIVDGSLLVTDSQGGFAFSPTAGLVGLRPLLLYWVAGSALFVAVPQTRYARAMTSLLAVPLLAMAARYGHRVLTYVSIENVAGEREHTPLSTFWEPWSLLAVLLLSAFALGALLSPNVVRLPRLGIRSLAFSIAGLVFGSAIVWVDPGESKQGRVRGDDSLSGVWEPAGRLLTPQRFGDFSTYSLASMTEHLSRRFAVTAHHEGAYTRELLDDYDVLVLKTLHDPLAPAEIEAIQEWVYDGGGLFAISDHTDLSGMSTHMEPLLRPFGMRFHFDSVGGASGSGQNHWTGPWIAEHPTTWGLPSFSYMTGCSLVLWGKAQSIMTLEQAASYRGDYSRSSNFGELGALPSDHQGLLIGAAAATHGKGRVVAFSDSTVLSSFCYYRDGHDQFVLRSVTWLNRTRTWARFAWIPAAVTGLLLVLLALRGTKPTWAHLIAASAPLAGGVAFGCFLTSGLLGRSLPVPEAGVDCTRVGFVTEGGHVSLPPVIGGAPELPKGENLSMFVQVPQRLGHETCIVPRHPKALEGLDILVVLNPSPHAPVLEAWIRSVRAWVEDGGCLIVTTKHADLAHGHGGPHEYLAGLSLARVEVQAPCMEVSLGSLGNGSVMLVDGSEHLDIEDLGHCMARPTAMQRRRLGLALDMFGGLVGTPLQERRTYVP
jgi:hypothetical protein